MAVTEESLAQDIGRRMAPSLGSSETPEPAPAKPEQEGPQEAPYVDNKFEFDENFQLRIAALILKDAVFNAKTNGLIHPQYFDNAHDAVLVDQFLKYWRKYKAVPGHDVVRMLVKKALDAKLIRKEDVPEIAQRLKLMNQCPLTDAEFVADEVRDFARVQATWAALVESSDLLNRKDVDGVRKAMDKAFRVGLGETLDNYGYFQHNDARRQRREEEADNAHKRPTSIPTGVGHLNKRLYHKGWGRKELSIIMGPAKAGKSTALAFFAKNAVLEGFHVLYITLEVSKEVTADRLDACLSGIPMMELASRYDEVRDKIAQYEGTGALGRFVIEERPTGSLTPSQLRRIIQQYKAAGVVFDMVVIDYMDIMAPDRWTDNDISNSKSVWVDVRAIAQEEGFAVLSATQTNRSGVKAKVVTMDLVAEDFNKIRIADIVISISKTEDEAADGVARLYFAASRNQATGFAIVVKQDLSCMNFIQQVIDVT